MLNADWFSSHSHGRIRSLFSPTHCSRKWTSSDALTRAITDSTSSPKRAGFSDTVLKFSTNKGHVTKYLLIKTSGRDGRRNIFISHDSQFSQINNLFPRLHKQKYTGRFDPKKTASGHRFSTNPMTLFAKTAWVRTAFLMFMCCCIHWGIKINQNISTLSYLKGNLKSKTEH